MKIMILGSGPERIGKTGELDRMANQAINYLVKEGHEIVYVDSNPNCIASNHRKMVTVYMEPLNLACVERIIEKEKPNSLIYSFGGRLATHLAIFLEREGILDKYGVRVLGTPVHALKRILEEEIFVTKLAELKIPTGELRIVQSKEGCIEERRNLGIPLIMRAAFALEGDGGYLVYNDQEIKDIAPRLLNMSPVRQIVLDRVKDDYIQIAMECFIDSTSNKAKTYLINTFENLRTGYDTHIGNAVLISPSPTLKGDLLKKAFDMASTIGKELELLGSYEIQFWYSINNNEIVVHRLTPGFTRFCSFGSLVRKLPLVEMNMSRYLESSIDDFSIDNLNISEIGRYISDEKMKAIRIPTFSGDLQGTRNIKTVMNATGARIFLGKTNEELIGKAVDWTVQSPTKIKNIVPDKLTVKDIMRLLEGNNLDNDDLKGEDSLVSDINPAFSIYAEIIIKLYNTISSLKGESVPSQLKSTAQVHGFSNALICRLTEEDRTKNKLNSSTVEDLSLQETLNTENRVNKTKNVKQKTVLVLGPGPYSIGWGHEIDIALVQTMSKLTEQNWKVILVNDNPDAISLESPFFDACYIETVTNENVEKLFEKQMITGVIHQFCADVPVELLRFLSKGNISTIGTPLSSMAVLKTFPTLWKELGKINVSLLPYAFLHEKENILNAGSAMGYPLIARLTNKYINPIASIVYEKGDLGQFILAYGKDVSEENPLFVEKYQEGLIGAEILAIADGDEACILGLLEHIEEYGVHRDDCASIIPTWSIGDHQLAIAEDALNRIVKHFNIIGHINLSLAIKGREVYVTGVSPYPARDITFLEKTFMEPLHQWVAQIFTGTNVKSLKDVIKPIAGRCYVKESVFPFRSFSHLDPILTPRMISIGQVMGQNEKYGKAFLKAQIAINSINLKSRNVFLSGRDNEKEALLQIANKLLNLGFDLTSTQGTAQFLLDRGLEVETIYKVSEGRPNILDSIINDKISVLVNIPGGFKSKKDEEMIRRAAIDHSVPLFTTISGALLMVRGIEELRKNEFQCYSLYTED
jgi:carbamoyl-phosphate synthase large subunit